MSFLSIGDKKRFYSDELAQEIGGINDLHQEEPFCFLSRQLQKFDAINAELFLNLKSYLPDDILVKVDRMSMAASIKTRVPFLDHKIVEFAFGLPGHFKIRGMTPKWLFKKTMQRTLPRPNIYSCKEGFSIPLKHWLRGELRELILDYLGEERIRNGGLFRFSPIKKMMDANLQGKKNYSHQLWAFIVFEI